MHERPEGDESNERILGKELDSLRERGAQESDLLLDDACVDDEEENGRYGGRGSGRGVGVILDGGVLREKLGREGFVGY